MHYIALHEHYHHPQDIQLILVVVKLPSLLLMKEMQWSWFSRSTTGAKWWQVINRDPVIKITHSGGVSGSCSAPDDLPPTHFSERTCPLTPCSDLGLVMMQNRIAVKRWCLLPVMSLVGGVTTKSELGMGECVLHLGYLTTATSLKPHAELLLVAFFVLFCF